MATSPEFKIGLTQVGLTLTTDVLSATEGRDVWPISTMQAYSQEFMRVSGRQAKHGTARDVWRFPALTEAGVQVLRAYDGDCFIRTRKPDNTWADFQAIMHFPIDSLARHWFAGLYRDLALPFILVVEV